MPRLCRAACRAAYQTAAAGVWHLVVVGAARAMLCREMCRKVRENTALADGSVRALAGSRDVHRFEFPGYVPPSELKFETLEPVDRKTLHHPSRGTLNEIYATAICGNDLTSSVLYVIGVTTTLAGQLAPLCLISVGLVLYLFKSVYGEVRVFADPHLLTSRLLDD